MFNKDSLACAFPVFELFDFKYVGYLRVFDYMTKRFWNKSDKFCPFKCTLFENANPNLDETLLFLHFGSYK